MNETMLVLGAKGQFGAAFFNACELSAKKHSAEHLFLIGPPHVYCDTAVDLHVEAAFEWAAAFNAPVTKVINFAAIHDYTFCDTNPGRAYAVNGAKAVATVAEKNGADYYYVSTDMVFENLNIPGGVNHFSSYACSSIYAKSKVLGEETAWEHGGTVLRVSSLFGHSECRGKKTENLVTAIYNRAKAHQPFEAVDRKIAITSAEWASEVIIDVITGTLPNVYMVHSRGTRKKVCHLVASNSCYIAELAKFIYSFAGADTSLVTTGKHGNSYPLLPDDTRYQKWEQQVVNYLKEKEHDK